jgi:hypothetical protein
MGNKDDISFEELDRICLEKLGKTLDEALWECDSVFDLVYDLRHAVGG